ncbi:MAG: Hsp20/alpha crystallin family protein [Chitinivibrionales bacterium]
MNSLTSYNRRGNSLADLFEDLFQNDFALSGRDITKTTWPEVDVVEEKEGYRLSADIPGVDKDDIEISVENGTLRISGEKKQENKEEKQGYNHFERCYGKFERSFKLPEDADHEGITADYKNGVLNLHIKKSEKAKPRSIEIE